MRVADVLKDILEISASFLQYVTLDMYLVAGRFPHLIKTRNYSHAEKESTVEANKRYLTSSGREPPPPPTHFIKLGSSLPGS
jgi:hypothetical protein